MRLAFKISTSFFLPKVNTFKYLKVRISLFLLKSKNKLSIKNTLFTSLISLLRELNYYEYYQYIFLSVWIPIFERSLSIDHFSFPFLIFPTGSSCQYRYDSQAFLFSLVNKPGWEPVKLPQTGQYSGNRYSIYDCSSYNYGPTFGGSHDIYIANYASSSSSSQANLGYAYSPPSGSSYGSTFARTFLAGGSNDYFTPDEVETFYETT